MIGCIVIQLLWSFPQALMGAELSLMFEVNGNIFLSRLFFISGQRSYPPNGHIPFPIRACPAPLSHYSFPSLGFPPFFNFNGEFLFSVSSTSLSLPFFPFLFVLFSGLTFFVWNRWSCGISSEGLWSCDGLH